MYQGLGGGGGGGGGVLPISHSQAGSPGTRAPWQPWLYMLGKAEYQSPSVDTYSVQERLYVLEYRSPTEGGKGGTGGGDNFCGRGTISASGLRPWGTISASRLCPGGTKSSGGQNLRGDRICSDSGSNYQHGDQYKSYWARVISITQGLRIVHDNVLTLRQVALSYLKAVLA